MGSPGKISLALAAACLLAAVPGAAPAQNISIDGRFSQAKTLNAVGGNYPITPDLGKQVGGNLFHSFGKFGLDAAEKATFSGPAGTQNVIGRVTGGAQSNIHGTIDSSSISGANLYLINPSGIVFGPTATVNVSGSFYASTANYLRMSDGAKFQATNPDASTLTMASPAAFGFITATPARIAVNGSALAANGSALGPGTLGLVAGPVSISGPTPTVAPRANLSAPAGTIHVTAVKGTGEVPINPRDTSALTVTSFDRVDVNGGSTLSASAPAGPGSGGSVFIRSGALTIDASTVAANNAGSGPGGQLVLRGDNQITLSNNAMVQAVTQGSGSGAEVTISTAPSGIVVVDASTVSALTTSSAANAGPGATISITGGQLALHNFANVLAASCITPTCDRAGATTGAGGGVAVSLSGSLTVDSASSLGTVTRGTGKAGDVSVIAAGPVTIDRGPPRAEFVPLAGIGSFTAGRGDAGDVAVSAGALTLTNNGLVSSISAPGAAGKSGDVSVNVSGPLSISGVSSGITATTFTSGKGGEVKVTAGSITIGSITIDSSLAGISSQAAPGSSGDAGGVTVAAGSLKIARSGRITSSTSGRGAGGGVSVSVAGELTIDGTMTAPGSPTGIISQANQGNTGNAGSISVSAGSVSIINSGMISGGTFGLGNGGSVSVNVLGSLTIDGAMTPGSFTGINSQANRGSTGNAGAISIIAGSISLANQGQISGLSFGSGNPGQITVAAGTMSIVSNGVIGSPVVGSPTSIGSGRGGSVTLTIDGQLTIDGTGGDPTFLTAITAQSQSSGDAGSVSVKAGALSINHIGQISSSTFAGGKGGTVAVAVDGLLSIDGSGTNPDVVATGIVTDSRAGSSGNAGDVSVKAGALSIVNGGSISSALRPFMDLPASTGNGGAVAVNVGGLLSLRGSGSRIGTETNAGSTGDAGSISVNAGQIALANGGGIISTTAGTGAGGSVMVTTPGALVLDGMGNPNTQIAASAIGPQSGRGGIVTVQAGSLTVESGAQIASSTAGPGKGGDVNITVSSDIVLPDPGPHITARSTGSGDAGSITVSATRLLMNNGAAISTEAVGQRSAASGGDITLRVRDFLYLVSSEISTSVKGDTGSGGNITIDPQLVILNHSSIIAQAIKGHGGDIMITAGEFIPSSDSTISATSQLGISGTIEINGPRVDVNGALVVLSSQLRGRTEVLREACAARSDRPISSLVEAGRGGLPQDPEATLPALYLAGRDVNPKPQMGADATQASSAPLRTTVRLTMRCG
jgi:filamentous hemagglutinin family protein